MPPVRLNEVLPSPARDWNGDGAVNGRDAWIELFNAGNLPVDMSGWTLVSTEGATIYVMPDHTRIAAGEYLVFYGSNILSDTGDTVRLFMPGGPTLVDSVTFGPLPADASYSRANTGEWYSDWPPSPGAQNVPPAGYGKHQKLEEVLTEQ